MSHYTVLVVGKNPEEQLAPYHEFECTGQDDQYVIDVDVTEEYQKEFEDQTASAIEDGETPETVEEFVESWYGRKAVTSEEEIDRDEEHKYGYVLVKDGKIVKAIRRTNPNAKWDWYVLGGRWNGYFKLKELDGSYPKHKVGNPSFMGAAAGVGFADSVLKKYIDVDGMRKNAENKAREKYRKAIAIIGHLPVNRPWSEIGEEYNYSDKAREIYHSQPRVAAWNADNSVRETFGFFSSPDDFNVSEEEYVKDAGNNALATFAVVMDGKWYEKGKMGWWAMVSDKKANWAEEFTKLFDSIPDNTLVSVYDCHI